MNINTRKTGAIFFAAALFVWLCAGIFLTPAMAAGKGAVKLTCLCNDQIVEGMQWSIYKVGERENDNSIASYGDFTSYYSRINDFSADHLTDMASTLENVAIIDKIPALSTQVSGASGIIDFSGLDPGLYLLSGKTLYGESEGYKATPSLVEVTEAEGIVPVNAKIRRFVTLGEEITSSTVRKVWDDEENAYGYRPESIMAEIYKDGELFTVVELNESNNWTYRWDTSYMEDWRVKESEVPPNYTVIYRSNDSQYVIVNTLEVDEEELVSRTTTTTTATAVDVTDTKTETTTVTAKTTTTDGGGKLPQTGQLWWPVPVLGFGGLIFIALGSRMNTKKRG